MVPMIQSNGGRRKSVLRNSSHPGLVKQVSTQQSWERKRADISHSAGAVKSKMAAPAVSGGGPSDLVSVAVIRYPEESNLGEKGSVSAPISGHSHDSWKARWELVANQSHHSHEHREIDGCLILY